MTATFNPTVCILGGDNIKLHKYMPNMKETATSNEAVVKIVTKAENRGAGWPPFSVWFPKEGPGLGCGKGSHSGNKLLQQLRCTGRPSAGLEIMQARAEVKKGHQLYK